jgi:hypothetical protein
MIDDFTFLLHQLTILYEINQTNPKQAHELHYMKY